MHDLSIDALLHEEGIRPHFCVSFFVIFASSGDCALPKKGILLLKVCCFVFSHCWKPVSFFKRPIKTGMQKSD